MACFLVPTGEAIVTTIAAKAMESKEPEQSQKEDLHQLPESTGRSIVRKLKWLSNLLWGGSVLLAFEHLWHGEVVPFFPFLTAMANPEDKAEMLHEMGTVGVTMAVIITVVWLIMIGVSSAIEKRQEPSSEVLQE